MEDEPRPKVDFVDKHHNCDKEFEEYSDYDCDLGPRKRKVLLLNLAVKGPWHVK